MNEYKIIEITLDDLSKCSSFWGYPNARLEKFLNSGTRKVFAYRENNEYVGGCALIVSDAEQGHFSDFFVRKDLRGKGIGSRILEFAIDYFKKMGKKRVRLHVDTSNTLAKKLYEKYGFRHFEDMGPGKIAMMKNL